MGCNCGNKNKVYNWQYVPGDGTAPKTYRSEIEARAAVIRNGRGSVKQVEAR